MTQSPTLADLKEKLKKQAEDLHLVATTFGGRHTWQVAQALEGASKVVTEALQALEAAERERDEAGVECREWADTAIDHEARAHATEALLAEAGEVVERLIGDRAIGGPQRLETADVDAARDLLAKLNQHHVSGVGQGDEPSPGIVPEGGARVGDRVLIRSIVVAADASSVKLTDGWHSHTLIVANEGPNAIAPPLRPDQEGDSASPSPGIVPESGAGALRPDATDLFNALEAGLWEGTPSLSLQNGRIWIDGDGAFDAKRVLLTLSELSSDGASQNHVSEESE